MEISKPYPVYKDTVMEVDCTPKSRLSRSNSSGSDNVDALAETVEALYVQEKLPNRPQAKELIQKLIQDFTEYDIDFLKEYLDVLQNGNDLVITEVTNNIVFTIEQAIKQQLKSNQQWQEPVLIVLLGWMCATVLSLKNPHVQSPYRALSELLLHTTMNVRVRLAKVFWRHLSPAQLIELADITTRPMPENQTPLSDLLLRAALCRLQPERPEPKWHSEMLDMEEVAAGLTSAWTCADDEERPLLAQVAARTHAVRALFAVAEAKNADGRPETLKVLVEMTKLRLLFLDDGKINEHSTKQQNKRKRKD